mmetsp:Transcript_54115/g.126364  ORF Transcript_54115/g.126364 Transcript_54115/m.126364 type:complete len:209 (+) Transcript_54115:951-1577(+)
MSLEILLDVSTNAFRMHRDVQLPDVFLELFCPEEHAEEKGRINAGQALVADGIGTGRVVLLPQFWVTQDLVSLRQLLELPTGLRVILILVWVQLQGHLVVVLLDLRWAGIWLDLQDVVKTGVCHLAHRPAIIRYLVIIGVVTHRCGLRDLLSQVVKVIDPYTLLRVPLLVCRHHLQSLWRVVDSPTNLGGASDGPSQGQTNSTTHACC